MATDTEVTGGLAPATAAPAEAVETTAPTSPAESGGATQEQDHRDAEPMSLEEYRQGLREKREAAELKASTKAKFDALTPDATKGATAQDGRGRT